MKVINVLKFDLCQVTKISQVLDLIHVQVFRWTHISNIIISLLKSINLCWIILINWPIMLRLIESHIFFKHSHWIRLTYKFWIKVFISIWVLLSTLSNQLLLRLVDDLRIIIVDDWIKMLIVNSFAFVW